MIDHGKVGWILAREYWENVRTKAFLLGVILTPVLIGLIVLVPMLFPKENRRVVIADGTGKLLPLLQAHFDFRNEGKTRGRVELVPEPFPTEEGQDPEAAAKELEKRLSERVKVESDQELFAAVVIHPSFLTDDRAVREGDACAYFTKRPTERAIPQELGRVLGLLRRPLRLQLLLERDLRRDPQAPSRLPLAERVIAPTAAPRASDGPRSLRLQVADGSGLVLPDLAKALAVAQTASKAAEHLARAIGRDAAALTALLPVLDAGALPPIEGAERPERVALLQLGLDPAALESLLPPTGADAAAPIPLADAAAKLEARIRAGTLDAAFVLDRRFLSRAKGPGPDDALLLLREGLDARQLNTLRALLRQTLWQKRTEAEFLAANVTPRLAVRNPERAGKRYESRDVMAKILVPMGFVILLFYGVFGIAQALLNSLIEEKQNRIVEVLLSSVTPLELMLGKILGTGLLGFTLVALWATAGYWTADWQLGAAFLSQVLRPELMIWFVLFYVLGFLLLASMIAAIGATCSTIKDAQNYMGVLSVLYIIPMLTIVPVSQAPEGTMAKVLSFVPPLTPFVMMNRLAASPEISRWELAGSVALLVVSIALAIWLASRVFRIGILLYGQPPSLRQILRWAWKG